MRTEMTADQKRQWMVALNHLIRERYHHRNVMNPDALEQSLIEIAKSRVDTKRNVSRESC